MLDDAAEVNVISQLIVLKCGLQKVDVPLPNMEVFRGEKGPLLGCDSYGPLYQVSYTG
jgi:hypothetical protein